MTSSAQHFWSLAVEEQFYIVWPLLFLAVPLLHRWGMKRVLWIGLLAIAIPSLVWSVVYTGSSPAQAFFVSTTRMWELAVGAIVALLATRTPKLPRRLAIGLGWLGLAAVIAAGLIVTTSVPWPSYRALLPTLGAAAIIAAGVAAGPQRPVAVLRLRPMQWIGELSYSLYSKMEQWVPAFQVLAAQNNWKLSVYIKSSCALSSATAVISTGPYPSCTQWNKSLLTKLVADRPEYVITSQGGGLALGSDGTPSKDAMIEGMRASWAALTAINTKIIVIANNPEPGIEVYACVAKHRTQLSACAFDRARHDTDPGFVAQRTAIAVPGGPQMIDLFDAICPLDPCAPVIGNVLLYRRTSHLTATYVFSMTQHVAAALTKVGVPAH